MVHSLREAFEHRGCPICLRLDKDEYDFMCRYQYQTLKEEKVRQDLVSSDGYCNFHSYEMERLTSPLVNAVVAKDLIDREIRAVEEGLIPSREGNDCPVCRYVRQREDSYLREVKSLLPEESFREEYERTDGLCRIHLKRIFSSLERSELGQFLLRAQVGHLKQLRLELEQFIDQGGTISKARGRVKNAWRIAINKRIGKKGLKEAE